MSFFDIKTNTPGSLQTQLSSDTTKTNSVAFSMVGTSVQTISTLLIGITLGFIYDWRLSLINLGIVPLTVISAAVQHNLQQGFSNLDEVVEANAGAIISECVSNTKSIYCYNMQGKVVHMYNRLLEKGAKTANKKSFFNGILFGFSQFVMYACYAVIYYAGGCFMYQGTLTMNNMFRAIFSLLFAGFGLGQAQQYVANLSEAKTALVNIFKTIDEKSKIDPVEISEKNPPAVKKKQSEFKGRIEFRNVSFRYTQNGKDVLKNINFIIEAGQKVAFVGSSGSGKSTIVQLIERFYDVTEGQILIDDIDIKEYDLVWLRHNMSCVMQEPVLFQTGIKQNIQYGKLNASDDEVIAAAIKAKILHKLQPDANINVSGGEKQRLALARAIINQPKILLLDEFTSALNSNLEKEILSTLNELNDGISTITIAHRLSTIENSDIIFVVEDGKVIESGNHDDLYGNKGTYYKLYNAGLAELKRSE